MQQKSRAFQSYTAVIVRLSVHLKDNNLPLHGHMMAMFRPISMSKGAIVVGWQSHSHAHASHAPCTVITTHLSRFLSILTFYFFLFLIYSLGLKTECRNTNWNFITSDSTQWARVKTKEQGCAETFGRVRGSNLKRGKWICKHFIFFLFSNCFYLTCQIKDEMVRWYKFYSQLYG